MTSLISGQVEMIMGKFIWKLENFSKLGSNVDDMIESPIFQIEGLRKPQCSLQLYPFGERDTLQNFLCLYLYNCSEVELNFCFELILSDVNEKLIFSKKLHENIHKGEAYGPFNMIKRDSILQKINGLPGDLLNITCIIYKDMYSEEEMDIDKEILNNYESLFYNEDFSDLTIVVKKNQMKVHKSILSARSPVFKAMLRHNMKEKNTSTIKITDVSYNIMKELLLFIYSGKVNDLNKNAKALLPVAEKYEIKKLKILCEKSILKNVKIKDACDTLSMANLYNCNKLKAKVMEFIVPNIKKIKETFGFKKLIRSNPELFEELFAKVIQ